MGHVQTVEKTTRGTGVARAADKLKKLVVAGWNRNHPFSGLELFDYIFLASLWLLTYPVFKLARLPYAFDLKTLSAAYWAMSAQAALVATAIAILGLPLRETLLPFFDRLRRSRTLVLTLLAIAVLLGSVFGPVLGLIIFVDALGVAELSQFSEREFETRLLDILIPGIYLFLGLIAVFAFSHATAGIRYGGTYDEALNRLDRTIFGGHVSSIAHWGFHHLPTWVLASLDFCYLSLWTRFGAALILIALLGNRMDAVKFVRTVLICYTIALLIFATIPAKGPYSIDKSHELDYPQDLGSYSAQDILATRMKNLYAHNLSPGLREVGIADYYISFPSLHTAMPVIAIWSLRRWRRIQAIFALVYLLLLLPSLVFLEWHYFIDILGGWGVAILAICIAERVPRSGAPAFQE